MKRFFALTLVLAMALSMMVVGASAAVTAPTCYCTNPNHTVHYYVYDISSDRAWFFRYNGNTYAGDTYIGNLTVTAFEATYFHVPATEGSWYWADAAVPSRPNNSGVCTTSAQTPPPTAQPKTGVMDTLPIWFGVMAVSACAYVLTSKKKVF